MALRGWRLFGVAGTIFAYVAGILLLSVISLNSSNQRRLSNGRYDGVSSFMRLIIDAKLMKFFVDFLNFFSFDFSLMCLNIVNSVF